MSATQRPGSPSAASRVDNHFKGKDGKTQVSPPKELNKLYNQGPHPSRISLSADINALKVQSQCCGVYALQKELKDGKPVWKHCTEDLVMRFMQIDEDDLATGGWIVARFTTSGSSKLQICMRVKTPDKECLPCGKTAGIWQEWNGRDWINAPSAKCRNTWHGWGLEKLDRTRIKYSPSSPNGAF